MATVTIDAPARVHRCTRSYTKVTVGSCRVGLRSQPRPWGTGPRDQLVITEAVTGRKLAELRSAVIIKPTWTLNGIGSMRFKLSASDTTMLDCLVDPASYAAGTAVLRLLGWVEAQFWRDGELRWSGPITYGEPDLDSGIVEFECWDLAWYLTRRFMGAAERRDLLDGIGSMDTAGLPGWTRNGVTALRDTTTKVRGKGAARIYGTGTLQALCTLPAQEVGSDGTVLLSLMVHLPESTPEGSVIASIRSRPTGSEPYMVTEANSFRTDSSTVLGAWTRITCRTMVKPNQDAEIDVFLWSLGLGNTYVDDCRAMRNDATGFAAPGKDLATYGLAIGDHAQAVSRGKSSFGIKFIKLGDTGTVEVMGFRHMEHSQILDLFEQFTERADGWDWWVDPQKRAIYFAPRRGKDQTEIALSDRTVLTGGWAHDETDKSTAVVVLGDADGYDRPEGAYVDASSTNGMILEHLEPAKNGRTLAQLDPTAKGLHAELSQPQTSLKPVRVPASWWTEYGVQPGDTFPNHLRCGVLRPATADDGFRVQTMTHDLDSDTLELV